MKNNQKQRQDIKELKRIMEPMFPDAKSFMTYIKPHLFRIDNEHKKMRAILKKIGVNNGLEGTWGLLCDTYKAAFSGDNFIHIVEQGFYGKVSVMTQVMNQGGTVKEAMTAVGDATTVAPMVMTLIQNTPKDKQARIEELTRRTEALPQEEQDFCAGFNLICQKLHLSYVMSHLPSVPNEILKIITKYFLISYYTQENELYDKELIPQKLINHIKNIPIVGEEKILNATKYSENPEEEAKNATTEIMDNFDTPVKAYAPKDLCKMYKVSDKTFKSWISPHLAKIGNLKGKMYTPRQVRIIFHIFGDPK
jgi:hypothetical protein